MELEATDLVIALVETGPPEVQDPVIRGSFVHEHFRRLSSDGSDLCSKDVAAGAQLGKPTSI